MVRKRTRKAPLSDFSEWHRSEMSSTTRYIDIDHVGLDFDNSVVNIIEDSYEVNHDCSDKSVITQSPIKPHKKNVYEWLADWLDVPVYYVWWNGQLKEENFVVQNVETEIAECMERPEFDNFLASFREDCSSSLFAKGKPFHRPHRPEDHFRKNGKPITDISYCGYSSSNEPPKFLMRVEHVDIGQLDRGISWESPVKQTEEEVYNWFSENMDIPVYYLWTNDGFTQFYIEEVGGRDKNPKIFSKEEFQSFNDTLREEKHSTTDTLKETVWWKQLPENQYSIADLSSSASANSSIGLAKW